MIHKGKVAFLHFAFLLAQEFERIEDSVNVLGQFTELVISLPIQFPRRLAASDGLCQFAGQLVDPRERTPGRQQLENRPKQDRQGKQRSYEIALCPQSGHRAFQLLAR
jgi:hypothetical protein